MQDSVNLLYTLCMIFCTDSGRGEDVADSMLTNYLKLTRSRVVMFEGGSVEFVCEASVSQVEVEKEDSGGHGLCVPYNVTWSVRSSDNDGAVRPVDTDTSSSSLVLLNNHLLRVGAVSRGSSRYCCQVHAASGHRISQECTTIHVVPHHGMS